MSNQPFDKQWQKRFERFAAFDTDAQIAGWSQSGLNARLYFFEQFFKPEQGLWLDVGTGAGSYARCLQSKGLEVVGLDYSAPSLIKAQQKSPHIPWMCANAFALPILSGKGQGCLCFGVLQAVQDERALLGELSRVLKKEGTLWIDGLNRFHVLQILDNCKRKLSGKALHLKPSSPFYVVKMLRAMGFVDTKVYWAPILPKPLQVLNRWLLHRNMQVILKAFWPITLMLSHAFYVKAKRGSL